MSLKPQDVLVCLHLALGADETWTYGALHEVLGMSVGELHKSIQRLKAAGLLDAQNRRLKRAALEEFLIHGAKYAFAPKRGARTRGVPTGAGASPLQELLAPPSHEPPVWPHPEGKVWGYEFAPLYKTVPQVALNDPKLYELLALVDGIRGGGARERRLAEKLLRERLQAAKVMVLVQDALPKP